MSKEAVVQMLSQVDAEPGLCDELTAALETSEGKADAIMAVAGKHGFSFTPEEFRDVVSDATASTDSAGELSDADLNQVAGGVISSLSSTSFSTPTINLAYNLNAALLPGGTFSMEGPGRP